MIKLNGNFYLKLEEVEQCFSQVLSCFKTSHRATLPQKIVYLDKEFVDCLWDEEKNLCIQVLQGYGYDEKHCSLKKIIQIVHDRFRSEDETEDKLFFMQYDLTDSQKRKHRQKYENYLINIFLDECIKKLENYYSI